MKNESLVEMLCKRFNRKCKGLEFEKGTGEVIETLYVNGEPYDYYEEKDCIIMKKGENRVFLYIDHGNRIAVYKGFTVEDYVSVYEDIVKITNKSIAVYTEDKSNFVVVEPKIILE